MPSSINLRNPGRTVHAGVILMNSVTELLDVSPIDILNAINKRFVHELPSEAVPDELKAQALDIEIHWVTESGKAPARMTCNLNVVPTDSFETCPPLDIVLTGANKMGYQASAAELAFLRKAHADSAAFLCICGGFQPALEAGLLQGKTATAPRPLLPMLRQQAPGTQWLERRWARDGKIWTSGALLNGLDMMSAWAEETWGGDGTLAQYMIRFGSWPIRDLEYKDVPWKI